RTSPSGCSIVSEKPGKLSSEKTTSLVRCRPISSRLSTAEGYDDDDRRTKRGGHSYSKNPRPAFVPSFSIHHLSTMRRRPITSPFENFAAARLPAITISSTVVSSNDLRNARVGGVQFSILNPPARSQATRSHSGWLID